MSFPRIDLAACDPLLTPAMLEKLFDATGGARRADAALMQIDTYRLLLAGPGIFSIQLNVTTRDDPKNEILLQRLYSSRSDEFPVQGRKHKKLTPWTDTLFGRGEVFTACGEAALAQTFDDFTQMRALGLNAVVNVPLMRERTCYATFNVFGTRGGFDPSEILALRVLALIAARWVTPAPDLFYCLDPLSSINVDPTNTLKE